MTLEESRKLYIRTSDRLGLPRRCPILSQCRRYLRTCAVFNIRSSGMTSRPRAEDEYEFAEIEFGLDPERLQGMIDITEVPLHVWFGQDETGCVRTLRIKNACPEAMAEARFLPPFISAGYYSDVTYRFDRVIEEGYQKGEFRHYSRCPEFKASRKAGG